jgi:hypothetical protein
MEAVAGVTTMLATGVTGAVTVNTVLEDPPPLAVVTMTPMVVLPADNVAATPVDGSIVATAVALLDQVAEVIGTFDPLCVAVTVNDTDAPATTVGASGAIVTTRPAGGGVAVFRGVGAPFAKSAALSLVSWSPLFFRIAAVVLLRLGLVGPEPSKQLDVVP